MAQPDLPDRNLKSKLPGHQVGATPAQPGATPATPQFEFQITPLPHPPTRARAVCCVAGWCAVRPRVVPKLSTSQADGLQNLECKALGIVSLAARERNVNIPNGANREINRATVGFLLGRTRFLLGRTRFLLGRTGFLLVSC